MLRRPFVSSLVFLVWTLLLLGWATAATVWVAAETAVGPVVVTLSHNHGIHAGDVLAGVLFYGGAVAVVAATAGVQLVRRRRWIRAGRPPTTPLGA